MTDLAGIAAAAGVSVSWLWDKLWDKFGNDIVSITKDAVKAEWDRFNWPEAEQRYRTRLREQYRFARLLGNPKPIEIENIYTDVYVLDQPAAIRRYTIEELQNNIQNKSGYSPDEEKRSPILDLARKEKRLYILGKPGAGKTTFLRYLTIQACNGKIRNTPIFIELKDWAASGLDLVSYVMRQFEICEFPDALPFIKYLLESGYAFVLFDGLDEVNQEGEHRNKMIRILRDFARQYPKVHICLTCRIAASDYSFEQFTYLEIADFTENQVIEFAYKWYKDEPEKGGKFVKELRKPENKGLKELTRTPLLLALLCLAFDQSLFFPPNRTELYRDALDALLRKWDLSRNIHRDSVYRNLTPGRKEKMLARLAAENFDKGDYFIHRTVLARQIIAYIRQLPGEKSEEEPEGDDILKAIEAQHGILVERAHNIYSFSHLTIQEYLTARYIVENAGDDSLESLINFHLTEDRWREVFLMTSSLLDDASYFMDFFLRAIKNILIQNESCLFLLKVVYGTAQHIANDSMFLQKTLILLLFAHGLKRAINLELALVHNVPFAGNTYFDEILGFPLTIQRVLDQTLAIANEFASKDTVRLNLEQVLNCNRNLSGILSRARNNKGLVTGTDLQYLFSLDTAIADILSLKFGIVPPLQDKRWEINLDQIDQIRSYIYANKLLLDCLNLSVVTNRLNFLSQMFLLPEN
jgi:predicted NACHT family NTPase